MNINFLLFIVNLMVNANASSLRPLNTLPPYWRLASSTTKKDLEYWGILIVLLNAETNTSILIKKNNFRENKETSIFYFCLVKVTWNKDIKVKV